MRGRRATPTGYRLEKCLLSVNVIQFNLLIITRKERSDIPNLRNSAALTSGCGTLAKKYFVVYYQKTSSSPVTLRIVNSCIYVFISECRYLSMCV